MRMRGRDSGREGIALRALMLGWSYERPSSAAATGERKIQSKLFIHEDIVVFLLLVFDWTLF